MANDILEGSFFPESKKSNINFKLWFTKPYHTGNMNETKKWIFRKYPFGLISCGSVTSEPEQNVQPLYNTFQFYKSSIGK